MSNLNFYQQSYFSMLIKDYHVIEFLKLCIADN